MINIVNAKQLRESTCLSSELFLYSYQFEIDLVLQRFVDQSHIYFVNLFNLKVDKSEVDVVEISCL